MKTSNTTANYTENEAGIGMSFIATHKTPGHSTASDVSQNLFIHNVSANTCNMGKQLPSFKMVTPNGGTVLSALP